VGCSSRLLSLGRVRSRVVIVGVRNDEMNGTKSQPPSVLQPAKPGPKPPSLRFHREDLDSFRGYTGHGTDRPPLAILLAGSPQDGHPCSVSFESFPLIPREVPQQKLRFR
jgi:hypothetical protein